MLANYFWWGISKAASGAKLIVRILKSSIGTNKGAQAVVCKFVFYSARDWSKLHFNTLTEAGWPGEETGFTYNFLIVSMAT